MSSSIQKLLPFISLAGSRKHAVKKLSGFSKAAGHREPECTGQETDTFLQAIGSEEVETQAQLIHRSIRAHLGFKRKDLSYQATPGAVRLLAPEFQVVVWIEGCPEDSTVALLRWEVSRFNDAAVMLSGGFIDAMEGLCRQLNIRFPQPVSVEATIDRIEDHPAGANGLDYPPDASRFTFKPANTDLQISMDSSQLSVSIGEDTPLLEMLSSSLEWVDSLLGP